MQTLISLVIIIGSLTILASCSGLRSTDSKTSLPPKLIDQPNPVVPGEQASKLLFREGFKNGTVKTAKEMMELDRIEMRSGELPVGSSIAPEFYLQNLGGSFQGVRVIVQGSAIDQGILSKPENMIIESSDSGQNEIQSHQCVEVPEITNHTGMVVWTVDAGKIGVTSNAQLRIALNCQTAKLGTADFVFTVYASENPAQPLFRHVESVCVRGWKN